MIILTKIDFFHPAFWSKMTVFKQNKHFFGGEGLLLHFTSKNHLVEQFFLPNLQNIKAKISIRNRHFQVIIYSFKIGRFLLMGWKLKFWFLSNLFIGYKLYDRSFWRQWEVVPSKYFLDEPIKEHLEPPPSKMKKEMKTEDESSSSSGLNIPTAESPKEILERISRHCSCTVCLDIPRVSLWQCKNGHLMCATCLSHLIADARLKDEISRHGFDQSKVSKMDPNANGIKTHKSCPNCRCDISWERCVRNLAAEKAVGELPTQCLYCLEEYFTQWVIHTKCDVIVTSSTCRESI